MTSNDGIHVSPDTPSTTMLQLRSRSGEVSYDELLVIFLYILMRDRITPGAVESILEKEVEICRGKGPVKYCNGWLAQYAADVARRLGVQCHRDNLPLHSSTVRAELEEGKNLLRQLKEQVKGADQRAEQYRRAYFDLQRANQKAADLATKKKPVKKKPRKPGAKHGR